MKTLGILGCTAMAALAIASCSSVPRIDGSSQAAFERSHAALVASLTPEDRLRLIFAEAIILSPAHCLTTHPIPSQPFLNKLTGGQADVSSCRKELSGLTFNDIMSRAYPQAKAD